MLRGLNGAGDDGGHLQEVVKQPAALGGVLAQGDGLSDAPCQVSEPIEEGAVFQSLVGAMEPVYYIFY